jgi:hypothetical protein
MLPWMDEGGVEALRWCGFVVEEEMHDGALSGSVRPMRGEKGGMALRPCGGEEGGPSAQVTERGVADRMWAWQSLSLSGGTTGAGMHWGGGSGRGKHRGDTWPMLLRGCGSVALGRLERTVAFLIYSNIFKMT